jgi:hypothetical protein
LPWLDSTTGERQAANAAIMERALRPEPQPEAAKARKRMRAKRNMMLPGSVLPAGRIRPGTITVVNAGEELDAGSPIVRAQPEDFEAVE